MKKEIRSIGKHVSFMDGGALDNKPFSYAIDTLSQREAPASLKENCFSLILLPKSLRKKPMTINLTRWKCAGPGIRFAAL
jgi:hypothetical protein